MQTIKWAICDDAEYICFSYKMELKEYSELEFMGSCRSTDECAVLLQNTKVDILLLDIQMDTPTSGIDFVPKVKEIAPETKRIMLTNYKDENYIFTAFANGADDYFLKTYPTSELTKVMHAVYSGTNMLHSEIAQILANKTKNIQSGHKSLLYTLHIMTLLSTSEFDVLKDICNGYSYREIADRRYVTLNTVKSQASRILKKFDAHDMKELSEKLDKLKVFELFR